MITSNLPLARANQETSSTNRNILLVWQKSGTLNNYYALSIR